MTEYDYSEEGYHRFLETRERIAQWVGQTEQCAAEFKAPFGIRSDYGDDDDQASPRQASPLPHVHQNYPHHHHHHHSSPSPASANFQPHTRQSLPPLDRRPLPHADPAQNHIQFVPQAQNLSHVFPGSQAGTSRRYRSLSPSRHSSRRSKHSHHSPTPIYVPQPTQYAPQLPQYAPQAAQYATQASQYAPQASQYGYMGSPPYFGQPQYQYSTQSPPYQYTATAQYPSMPAQYAQAQPQYVVVQKGKGKVKVVTQEKFPQYQPQQHHTPILQRLFHFGSGNGGKSSRSRTRSRSRGRTSGRHRYDSDSD